MSIHTPNSQLTCYEVIGEVDDAMRDNLRGSQNYFVLGGIVTGALKDTGTIIDHKHRGVLAADSSDELVVRPNGTVRDIDILVTDVLDDAQTESLVKGVDEAVAGRLEVSIFGLDKHEPEPNPTARAKRTFADWISSRTVDAQGHIHYELFPLDQPVDDSTFAEWRLVTPQGHEVSALNPAGHMLAYAMRSISGVREKDASKVGAMMDRILSDEVFEAEVLAGSFRQWFDFANAVRDIRTGRMDPASPMLREGTTGAELAAFRWKGKLLSALESNQTIVDIGQQPWVQNILNVFVHAN